MLDRFMILVTDKDLPAKTNSKKGLVTAVDWTETINRLILKLTYWR